MNGALLFGMFSAPQNPCVVLVPELKRAVRRLMCGAKVEWLRLVSIGKSGLNLASSPSGGQDAGKWVFYLEDEDRTSPRCHVLAVSHSFLSYVVDS